MHIRVLARFNAVKKGCLSRAGGAEEEAARGDSGLDWFGGSNAGADVAEAADAVVAAAEHGMWDMDGKNSGI